MSCLLSYGKAVFGHVSLLNVRFLHRAQHNNNNLGDPGFQSLAHKRGDDNNNTVLNQPEN